MKNRKKITRSKTGACLAPGDVVKLSYSGWLRNVCDITSVNHFDSDEMFMIVSIEPENGITLLLHLELSTLWYAKTLAINGFHRYLLRVFITAPKRRG